MSMAHEFATFLNKIEPMVGLRKWKGIHVDALDKLFHKGVYRGHIEFGELVLPSTLDHGTTSMLLRMWGGFRMLRDIAGGRIVPRGDGAFFEWPDPNEVGVAPSDPLPVAKPDGIRPETKIETFVRRLNESPKKLASGPFRSEAWRYLHHIYSGDHVAGIIEDGRLTIMAPIGTGTFVLLHEAWRSLDAPPEIPPRVQRFLDALAEYEIGFKDDFGYTVEAPFTVTPPRSSGILITLGNGVEFGEINGDHFVADTSMEPTMRATLEHIWRETIRVEAMINKIAALEAELAAKTARLDQIAALLKANP